MASPPRRRSLSDCNPRGEVVDGELWIRDVSGSHLEARSKSAMAMRRWQLVTVLWQLMGPPYRESDLSREEMVALLLRNGATSPRSLLLAWQEERLAFFSGWMDAPKDYLCAVIRERMAALDLLNEK